MWEWVKVMTIQRIDFKEKLVKWIVQSKTRLDEVQVDLAPHSPQTKGKVAKAKISVKLNVPVHFVI